MARARSGSRSKKRDTPRRRPTAGGGAAVPTRRVPRDLAAETDEEPMGGVRQEPVTRQRAAGEPS